MVAATVIREVMEDDKKDRTKTPLPVWIWIGGILAIYGTIISTLGVYFVFHKPDTQLGKVNPNLWWGLTMLLVGLILLTTGYRIHKREKFQSNKSHKR